MGHGTNTVVACSYGVVIFEHVLFIVCFGWAREKLVQPFHFMHQIPRDEQPTVKTYLTPPSIHPRQAINLPYGHEGWRPLQKEGNRSERGDVFVSCVSPPNAMPKPHAGIFQFSNYSTVTVMAVCKNNAQKGIVV
jgi:hypothetical protein